MISKYEIINEKILSVNDTQEKFFNYLNSLNITSINNIDRASVSFINNMIYARYGQRTTMSAEKNYSTGSTVSTCVFEFKLPKIPQKILFSGQITSYFTTFFRLNIATQNNRIVLLGQTNPSGIFLEDCRTYEKLPEVDYSNGNFMVERIPAVFEKEYNIESMNLVDNMNEQCIISFHSPSIWNTGVCNGIHIRQLEILANIL